MDAYWPLIIAALVVLLIAVIVWPDRQRPPLKQ